MDKEFRSILIVVGIISSLFLLPTTMQSYAQINNPICCQQLPPITGPLPDVPLPEEPTTEEPTTEEPTTEEPTTEEPTTEEPTTEEPTTDSNNMPTIFANQGSAGEQAQMANQVENGLFGDIMQ